MKSFIDKYIKITFLTSTLFLLAFFKPAVCQTKKPTTSDIFKNIENIREVFTGNDSLKLYPFEMFSIMTFKNIAICGMHSSMIMESEKYNTTFSFDEVLNEFKYDDIMNECDWHGKKATIFLKTIQDPLKRDLYRNEKYKVIFSYWNDSEVLRTNVGTEYKSGFYIVDIIPLTSLFERQKEYNK
jgi:hypothetical protein